MHTHGDQTSSDSYSEDEPMATPSSKDTSNGVNGKANGEVNGKMEVEEYEEAGMKFGQKTLYAGKEDKKGRYQWQETEPEDIGSPAENAETAQWALLVRKIKVYNDPRRVLAIHSILIQSPLLKKLLERVLKDYPGLTVNLNRLELSGKFEPVIHRWTQLQDAINELNDEDEEERAAKEHAELFFSILKEEFTSVIEASQDMKSKGVMTYDYLWTLFQPGALIYARQDGQETAMRLHETKYGQDRNGNPCFWLTCKYIDWDGAKFGTNKLNLSIPCYRGTRHMTQLPVYPFEYHKQKDKLQERLIERGRKAEELAGSHYRAYHGVAWKRGSLGTKDKYDIKGRIVIDTYGWNKFNPSNAIFVTPLTQKDQLPAGTDQDDGEEDEDDYVDEPDDGGMPLDGHFEDVDEAANRIPLTTEQKLICTPLLRGYSLKDKLWLNFFVNCVRDIEWQKDAFDRLVLPSNQKELILGFTESQRAYKESFDDVIQGKGKGIILLLCGPPGVGKTLTAESVAEEMKVPLYMMSAGDLGLDPRNVETKLQNVLEMCTKWNAILLLDEADVFLEQRSLHELERNKLVSIFLRVLEYYEGIMFLTTNRVETFDPAFQSRIHISLDYPELSIDSRRTVWKNFLAVSSQENTITEAELRKLSQMSMNGRQIKNVLKTAQLLARRKKEALGLKHVEMVLDVTQHLHNATRETERTRSSIFC